MLEGAEPGRVNAVGVGAGWLALAGELEQRLQSLEPPAALLGVGIDGTGLPRFRVRIARENRKRARELVRAYEDRAATVCQACGGPGRVRAGAVVTVLCQDCAPAD